MPPSPQGRSRGAPGSCSRSERSRTNSRSDAASRKMQPTPRTSPMRWSGLSVSNECARIFNAFVGAALEMNTLTASMGNMSVQQGPRGVDRGRHQSFFALNAPQGNPFAAAGAASVPFPSSIQQQPFTRQYFEKSRTSVQEYSWTAHLPSAYPLYPATSFTMGKAAKIKFKVRKFFAKDTKAADITCSPRALVALESQLVRLCEICTVCLGLNGVQVNVYSVELAHSFEL